MSDTVAAQDFPLGPDLYGAFWLPVAAHYDRLADQTTVRLRSGSYDALKAIINNRKETTDAS